MKKPFSRSDANFIQNEIKSTNRIGFLSSLLFVFVIQGGLLLEGFEVIKVEAIALAIVLIIILITKNATKKRRKELGLGYKLIEEHPIVDKNDFRDNEAGLGGITHKYYVVANRNKHYVSKEFYNEVEKDDRLLIHLSPICNTVLGLEYKKRSSQ